MEKILVIKLSALGDIFLAMGAMEAIRKNHPQAHITLLTTRPFVDITQRSGYFNAVFTDTRPAFYDLPGWFRLYRFFNGGDFTRVYDLQMNDRTRHYYGLFRKKPEWCGTIRGAKLCTAIAEPKKLHAFERHKAMLAELGIGVHVPDLSWMQADISLFRLKKPYVLLVPGSSPQHPEKRWPAMKYGALALRLGREGYEVAVLGGAAERDAVERIVKSCPAARDFSGQTSLYDIATMARGAAGAIGNDTGPTHLIAMSGCPTLALFNGTTNPGLSAPVGPAVTVIQSESVEDIALDDVMKNFHPRAAEAA